MLIGEHPERAETVRRECDTLLALMLGSEWADRDGVVQDDGTYRIVFTGRLPPGAAETFRQLREGR